MSRFLRFIPPLISLAGLCILAFICGAAVMYYQFPGVGPLSSAFEGGRAWCSVWLAGDKRLSEAERLAIAELKNHPETSWDSTRAYNGYTLISLLWSENVYLVDMQGRVVHQWNMPFRSAWPHAVHVHVSKAPTMIETAQLLPNGDIIAQYYGNEDTPYGYGLAKIDKDSHVVWTYSENAHHSFYIDRGNGEIYGLVQKLLVRPENSADTSETLHYPMLTDYIVKLSPEGKELDRISILEAFRNTKFASLVLRGEETRDAVWDYMHTNSVAKLEPDMAHAFPMFKAGQILVSLRNMSVLAAIDPESRKVVWAAAGDWKRQHSAGFAANGHIILFDNQGAGTEEKPLSRMIEIDPATHKIVKYFPVSKPEEFYSEIHGRVQALANGNRLIAESDHSRLWELTASGAVVWTYKLPKLEEKDRGINGIVSAVRYSARELPFLKEEMHETH